MYRHHIFSGRPSGSQRDAPVASNVAIASTYVDGTVLTVTYDYSGASPESGTTFKWFRDGVEIAGQTTNSYTPTTRGAGAPDYGVDITCEVTPSDGVLFGTPVPSNASEPTANPLWANTSFLLHAPGEGVTAFTDYSSNGIAITANGGVQGDTGVTLFGKPTVLVDGTGDSLQTAANAALGFGTGTFCVELFLRASSLIGGDNQIWDLRHTGASADTFAMLYSTGPSGTLDLYGGGTFATGSNISANTMQHVMVSRESGVHSVYVAGARVAQSNNTSRNYQATKRLHLMANYLGTTGLAGNFGEVRVTKGATPYPGGGATITVPTKPHAREWL